jgi:molecular chaperone HtpG
MPNMTNSKEYQFQAETRKILELVIHSLYTNKEIFLRELISNASDALDRLRFEGLTNPELLEGHDRYEIRLEVDREAKTLSISDTGIGMSRDEVIANIGTIAKSGTRELRERIKDGMSNQLAAELIGQFGVGFYSAFMVANKVTLLTRRAGESTATLWESTGDGNYCMGEAARSRAGTTITLHLNSADAEYGIEDYTDQWVLSRIVKRYSDFVAYPILCKFEREEVARDAEGNLKHDAPPVFVFEDKTLNSMKPIWGRNQAETTDAEYTDFYRHITHDWTEPFKTLSLKAEGAVEYQALLFIPSKAPYDLFYHGAECGLRLYAKKVMVLERCEDLLPRYLRFIKGVVDSSDLPLNISRQMLQQDRHIAQIRKWLTRKVLDALLDLKENEVEKYQQFWNQFGRAIKEGVSSDYDNRDKILSLLLFQSSNDPEKLTTLHDYVGRMKEEQTEIYYLTGENRGVVENSPHLEAFKAKGYEVLYLIEPVDELLAQSLPDFESKRLKSVGKGSPKLGSEQERQKAEEELRQKEEAAARLLSRLQKSVDSHVKQVCLSNRLVSSPACLVGTEMDYSPQLERLLQKGKGGGPKQRRILELNPNHDVFTRMSERFKDNIEDEALDEYANLLLGYALLAEGSEIPDPVTFNRNMVNVMLRTL